MTARSHALTPTGAFRPWATVLVCLAGVGLALLLAIAYVRAVDRRAETRNVERQRQICGIITIIDDRNQAMPPANDAGTTAFRDELHRYRQSLGC